MPEVNYVTLPDVLAMHMVLIKRFGGSDGVRDMGSLESAVARPQSGYYKDVIESAAALFESLAINHPFIDGNGRSSRLVMNLILLQHGYVIANMDFVILMTMMGIISLAGIVVKNGIVLMDFFVLLMDEKVSENKQTSHDDLTIAEIKEVIIQSGKSRLRPVLLTALTAILGLIPLAIGLNFDFFSLVTNLNPHVYVGGDNVVFWGPLAWTIIFGLTYATVLTLVMVPVMFYLVKRTKYWLRDRRLANEN